MSFTGTMERVLTYAKQLWSSQTGYILLLAVIYAFSNSTPFLSLLGVLVSIPLSVHWIKTGARKGSLDSSAMAGSEMKWMAYLGVGLGPVVWMMLVAIIGIAVLLFGVVGVVIYVLMVLAMAILIYFYSPPITVEARGFREAFAGFTSKIVSFEKREYLVSSKFWAPLSPVLAFVVLGIIVPNKGIAGILSVFLLSLVSIPVNVGVTLVIYENIWKREAVAVPAETV